MVKSGSHNLTFLIFIILGIQYTFALPRIEKNHIILSGRFHYNSHSPRSDFNYGTSTLTFTNEISYFLSNQFSLGGFIRYNKLKLWDGELGKTVYTFGAGPISRYYFQQSGVDVFISSGYMFANKNVLGERDYLAHSLILGTGINLFISKHISIEPYYRFYYTFYKQKYFKKYENQMDNEFGIGISAFLPVSK